MKYIKTYESILNKIFKKKKHIIKPLLYPTDINDNLLKSIEYNDYNEFVELINKGADVNYTKYIFDDRIVTPLTSCIFGWTHNDKARTKFIKTLIDNNVNLFDTKLYTPNGQHHVDVIQSIEKLVEKKYAKEIIDYILKKHPNYKEELEANKTANKYNL
jgi:hypothetical protein